MRLTGEQKTELVMQHIAWTATIVEKYCAKNMPGWVDREDMVQMGMIGLLDAAGRYDPDSEASFKTYAVPRILGTVMDDLREQDPLTRNERNLYRSAITREEPEAMEAFKELVDSRPGHIWPNLLIEIDRDRDTEEESRGRDAQDLLGEVDPEYEAWHNKVSVDELMCRLPEREQMVIVLYYYEGYALREIGEVMEVTESRVSQLHGKALSRMRAWHRSPLQDAA